MGRATGLGSMFTGKVGNIIGYLTKNRQGRYVQSVKAYQPIVANPQSIAQALARIPLGPTQRFYNALAPLIKRGFEGVAYGDASKAEFLSYNLANFRGPYLTKSDLMVAPGPFLVSKGSLAAIQVIKFVYTNLRYRIVLDITPYPNYQMTTIGEISDALLKGNEFLNAGDQLTFVVCHNIRGEYRYQYKSFILDPNDTTDNDGFTFQSINKVTYLAFESPMQKIDCPVVAACCIRSQAFGETGYRRSTNFMSINPDIMDNFTQEALAAAVVSYRESSTSEEDWPIDPTPEYQQFANLVMIEVTNDMVDGVDVATYPGIKCLGYVTKGGEFGIFYKWQASENHYSLLDGSAKFLSVIDGLSVRDFPYNENYQPALQYLDAYGKLL